MKSEDKELLLKDLCARLPYGVKVEYYDAEAGRKSWEVVEDLYDANRIDCVKVGVDQYGLRPDEVKPYLFPMSSMTEEQEKEYRYTLSAADTITYDTVDWLNKNHFDYRGLIPMGLALDATGLNIY